MKNFKRTITTLLGPCLSVLAVAVLALAMIMPSAAMSATPVDLGMAGNYAILAKTGITTTADLPLRDIWEFPPPPHHLLRDLAW